MRREAWSAPPHSPHECGRCAVHGGGKGLLSVLAPPLLGPVGAGGRRWAPVGAGACGACGASGAGWGGHACQAGAVATPAMATPSTQLRAIRQVAALLISLSALGTPGRHVAVVRPVKVSVASTVCTYGQGRTPSRMATLTMANHFHGCTLAMATHTMAVLTKATHPGETLPMATLTHGAKGALHGEGRVARREPGEQLQVHCGAQVVGVGDEHVPGGQVGHRLGIEAAESTTSKAAHSRRPRAPEAVE